VAFVFGGGSDLGAGRMNEFVGQAMGEPIKGFFSGNAVFQ